MAKPEQQNPIDRLVAKFKRASDIEVKFVRGIVEDVTTVKDGDRHVYVLHIANGPKRDSFWLPHNYGDPYFYPPRQHDHVQGVINTLDDSLELFGETHKPIFDFKNNSNDSEREAFAWFDSPAGKRFAEEAAQRRAQEQAAPQLDDKARDTLYRRLGLSGLQGPQ
jgi:hypothetical protein